MENFPLKGGVLLVSNHLSYADPVFIGAAFPRKIRYLAYSGLANSRIMRKVFELTKTVTVSPDRSLESIKTSVDRLKKGTPLCVFAEGGISRLGTIFSFKRGVLLLAKQAKVPILPVHLDGVWGSIFSMERGKFFKKWPLSFPYRVTVRVGSVMDASHADGENMRSEVMELGRLSFTERLPRVQQMQSFIEESFRTSAKSESFRFENGLSLTRRDMAKFLTSGNEIESLPAEFKHSMKLMLALFQEVDGSRKIWASYLRIRETHLWDQAGFKVECDQHLKLEWILWAAFLGEFLVDCSSGFLIIRNPMRPELDNLQVINGVSTDRSGLISLNYRSVSEQKGEFDELERGYKVDTFGRLLPGLSYTVEPGFGVLGSDGKLDQIDFVEGIDAEGFLVPK
jgi:1-acyl-sn-glycerol-3-phosphate acyltransferase